MSLSFNYILLHVRVGDYLLRGGKIGYTSYPYFQIPFFYALGLFVKTPSSSNLKEFFLLALLVFSCTPIHLPHSLPLHIRGVFVKSREKGLHQKKYKLVSLEEFLIIFIVLFLSVFCSFLAITVPKDLATSIPLPYLYPYPSIACTPFSS